MVLLGSCPHRLRLPFYAALRVRAEANLRRPACRATATVNETDRTSLRQHSNGVMVEVLAVERQERPANEGARAPVRSTTSDRRRRALYSICRCLVKVTTCVQVSCSCDAHHRRPLGFCEDAIPRTRTFTGVHQVRSPNPARHEEHQEVDLHRLLQYDSILAGRWTRSKNARSEAGPPLPRSVS